MKPTNTYKEPTILGTQTKQRITSYEYDIFYSSIEGVDGSLTIKPYRYTTTLNPFEVHKWFMEYGLHIGEMHYTPGAIIGIKRVRTIEGNV